MGFERNPARRPSRRAHAAIITLAVTVLTLGGGRVWAQDGAPDQAQRSAS